MDAIPRPVTLALEHFGECYDKQHQHYAHLLDTMRIGSYKWKQMRMFTTYTRRPWVARITGTSETYGLEREFLKGMKDYSQSNSNGSRGVYLYYHLYPGNLYEVRHFTAWTNESRYFCRVEEGRVVRMEKDEVLACLS